MTLLIVFLHAKEKAKSASFIADWQDLQNALRKAAQKAFDRLMDQAQGPPEPWVLPADRFQWDWKRFELF